MSREILEALTTDKYAKCNPPWLEKLQLDGYNEQDKIAFEYQGQQHYKEIPFFHRTSTAFTEQLERDLRKKDILKSRNIDLIEIPYTYSSNNHIVLRRYIVKEYIKIYIKRRDRFEYGNIIIDNYKTNHVEYSNMETNEKFICKYDEFIGEFSKYII